MQETVQVIGFCFESRSQGSEGTATGPAMIRWGLQQTETYSIYSQQDTPYFDDFGDRYFRQLDGLEVCDAMQYDLASELRKGPYVLLGGDHLLTLSSLKFLMEQRNVQPRVIHLGAHLDRLDEEIGQSHTAKTVMRRVDELAGPERVHSFGLRTQSKDELWDESRFFKIDVFEPLEKVLDDDPSDDPIYLTMNLDVLNLGDMSAVSQPIPGGISLIELIKVIDLIGDRLVAADIVGFTPTRAGVTPSASCAGIVFRELLIALDSQSKE